MRRERLPRLFPALAPLVALLAPAAAHAWQQALTPEEPHRPLHLAGSNCIPYTLLDRGSDDLPLEEVRAAVTRALDTWTNVDCSFLAFVPTADATCCGTGFQPDGPNANCIRWLEDGWPERYPSTAIALTTVTYSLDDGRILDADVELNGTDFTFGDRCELGITDIWNTVTHEAGHMFGLDHSDVTGATMRPSSYPGDCALRDLELDDTQGLCTLYPLADDPDTCLDPAGGLNLDCTEPDDCGCRAPGSGRAGGWSLALAAVLLACARRRRPRR